jgi:hypothetical protein
MLSLSEVLDNWNAFNQKRACSVLQAYDLSCSPYSIAAIQILCFAVHLLSMLINALILCSQHSSTFEPC